MLPQALFFLLFTALHACVLCCSVWLCCLESLQTWLHVCVQGKHLSILMHVSLSFAFTNYVKIIMFCRKGKFNIKYFQNWLFRGVYHLGLSYVYVF